MQDDPRIVPTELIDEMRERCGLEADFTWRGRWSKSARGTGRTTTMLLGALAAFAAGKGVTIVGQVDNLKPMMDRLMATAGVAERNAHPLRFIDYASHLDCVTRGLAQGGAVFVDHWAAHQMVEKVLGATVMEP